LESLHEHQNLIDLIKKYKWKEVVLVGGDFNKVTHSFLFFENSLQAAAWFKNKDFSHSNILIKGSRSTAMEKVLE
jgi:UDP-N-acetylmuramoyl-tripeptide--D-alanyl-D-alanine ligase